MSRTIDDLRRTLETHSRELPLSEPRAVAVHRRIRRIRRQRISAGTAALVAVSLVGTLVVHATTRPVEQSGATAFPQYAYGGRLVATLTLPASPNSLEGAVSFVPPSSTVIVAQLGCTPPPKDANVFVNFAFDGKAAGRQPCGRSGTSMTPGITPGRPTRFSAWLSTGPAPSASDNEARLSIYHVVEVRLGIYTPVPRSEYVFPPRPAHLESLAEFGNPGTVVAPRGTATEPTTVGVSTGLRLEIDAVEPGVVTVELNGTPVATASTWDYTAASTSIDVTSEQLVAHGISANTATLTLRGAGFADSTSAWKAVVDSPIVGGAAASGSTR